MAKTHALVIISVRPWLETQGLSLGVEGSGNRVPGAGSQSISTALSYASCSIELLDPAPRTLLRAQYDLPRCNYLCMNILYECACAY